MQMNGLAELVAVKRHWARWDDPRLVVAILHSVESGDAGREPQPPEGVSVFDESGEPQDIDYAAVAAALGLNTITVDRPDQLGRAWEQALSADRPTVLDVHTDPNTPRRAGRAARPRNAGRSPDPVDAEGEWEPGGRGKQTTGAKLRELLPRQAGPADTRPTG